MVGKRSSGRERKEGKGKFPMHQGFCMHHEDPGDCSAEVEW